MPKIYQTKLRYSSIFGLRFLVGSLFILLSFLFFILILMPLLNILGLDTHNTNNSETLLLTLIFISYLISCYIYLTTLFNAIFEKNIRIEHLDKDIFLLQINQKKQYIAYAEIKKIKLTVNRGKGKYRGFIRGRLLIKTKYQKFIFTTDEKIEHLEGLKEYIEYHSKQVR